jgi:hypothetical protein
MYTGHLGIALAAKSARQSVPLWVLVIAAQGCDWVDAGAWLVGHADPASSRWLVFGNWTAQMVSHSVPSVVAIAILIAGLYYAATHDGLAAILVAGATLSHVLVDYITAAKPTWPGGPRIGLSLYSYPFADFVVETALVLIGWLLYRRSLPERRGALPAAWLMLAALVALQLFADAIQPRSRRGIVVDYRPRSLLVCRPKALNSARCTRTAWYFRPTSHPAMPRDSSQLSSILSIPPNRYLYGSAPRRKS